MTAFENLLLNNLWFCLIIWLILYVGDYYLTLWGAKLYHAGAKEHIVFESSYELTPQFRKDINALRVLSPRFIMHLLASVVLIVFLQHLSRSTEFMRSLFLLAYGALVFTELAVLVRHARSIALFRRLRSHQGITGHIEYAQWLALELSSVELLFMGFMLFSVFVATESLPSLGGSIRLGILALQHLRLSQAARKSQPEGAVETDPEQEERNSP